MTNRKIDINWQANPTDLPVFKGEAGVFAGFTRVPTVRDEAISKWAGQCQPGQHVIRLGQVHGKKILKVDEAFLAEAEKDAGLQAAKDAGLPVAKDASLPVDVASGYIFRDGYDGLMTNIPGILLTTGHGDCLPVWVYDSEQKVAGLAHAGWKGTALGIAGELVREMASEYGCDPADLQAYIGPGISLCCFEVSEDARAEFAAIPWGEEFIHDDVDGAGKPNGKSHIDLKGVNRRWLELAGVCPEKIGVSGDCTCCDSEHYYSYRRDGDMRRMAAYFSL